MQIKKRSLPMYIFLNCITLGIYGFIVSMHIGDEINELCKGDGEKPRFGYAGAVMFRGIPGCLGIITGLIFGLMGSSIFNIGLGLGIELPNSGAYKAILIFSSMTLFGLGFSSVGSLISGIYLKYWWYKQANRLKLNANRYGLTVKEGGTDNFLFHTVMETLFSPITVLLFTLSFLMPGLIVWLISLSESLGAVVAANILLFFFTIPLMFFGMELTTGSNFAMYFIFKNLNRYADVYRNGAKPFDPMGYEYYPSLENKYPNCLPEMISPKNNEDIEQKLNEVLELVERNDNNAGEYRTNYYDAPAAAATGNITCTCGSCAGYTFDLPAGEEVIIGKDPKNASIVIDAAYKEISRKHVGVCFDVSRNMYRVTDYSSNGTWADGVRMVKDQPSYFGAGTVLKLANDKNIFRLG